MEDWLTYRLSDLLLFSPRTYYRLFELHNRALWPAHLALLGAGVSIAALVRRGTPWSAGAAATLLSACWLFVAWAYHLERYATINWAARYFAVLFVVQAAVLVWYGPIRRRLTFRGPRPGATWLAPTLFLLAVVLPPLAGRGANRTWGQVELIGLTPDATAVATLGLLLVARPRAPRALVIAPLCWCVIGGATLWALESPEAWVSAAAGIAGLGAMLRRSETADRSRERSVRR